MLQRAASNAYSWWWASHIRTKQSKWLEQNLQAFEEKVGSTMKLIEEEGDSFAKRAQMYYNNRPLLIMFVQESYLSYRSLAERFDHLSTELQKANTTIATIFPEQIQFSMEEEEEDEFNAMNLDEIPNETESLNAPKAPAGPAKKFHPKAGNKLPKPSVSSISKVQKSGLSKAEGIEKIDRLQKEILVLQTEKEFLKSSYEHGVKRFRGIEKQIVEMQQEVFKLQDEFGDGTFIEDDEARALMASSALKSCQVAITTLQKKQDKVAKEASADRDKIKKVNEKIKSTKLEFFTDEQKSKSTASAPKWLTSKEQKKELETLCEEIKEQFAGESSLSVTEMAEKIDNLVNKVLDLETDISGETALVMSLRAETDDLQAQIQILEDEKPNLVKGSGDLVSKVMKMEDKMKNIQEIELKIAEQSNTLLTSFTGARCNLVHLSQKLSSVMPDEELDAIAAAPPIREKKSKKSKKEKKSKKKRKDMESTEIVTEEPPQIKDEQEKSKESHIESEQVNPQDQESKEQEVKNSENSNQDLEPKEQELKNSENSNQDQETKEQEVKNSENSNQDQESKEQEVKNSENSNQDEEVEVQEPVQSRDQNHEIAENEPDESLQETKNSENSNRDKEEDQESKVEEPVESQDQKHESSQREPGKSSSSSQPEPEPEPAEASGKMENSNPIEDSQIESKSNEEPETQSSQSSEKNHDTVPSGNNKKDLDLVDEEIFLDVDPQDEPKEEKDDEPNWRELFMDVQKRLLELENKSQDGLFDTTLHLRELQNANSMKDEEIKSLLLKLRHLQAKLDALQNKAEEKPETPQTPRTSIEAVNINEEDEHEHEHEQEIKFLLQGATSETSETELKFRGDIDELLEENLDFWLRFSASFHKVQKFEAEIEDLKSDASRIIKEKKGEAMTSRTTSLKVEATSIYKHLREIHAELSLWLETSASLKEELQRRFSSICSIQEEMTRALKESAGDEDFTFTTFQAAKFQGEILNMKQENNKVADELQEGLDHVSEIQARVDTTLAMLNDEFGFSGTRNANRQLQHRECRNRVPFRSLIFGEKLKKQKQTTSSIFSSVSPLLNKKCNISK